MYKLDGLQLCLSFCLIIVLPIYCDYVDVTNKYGTEAVEHCIEKCPFQNRSDSRQFDFNCDTECSRKQCTNGCNLWYEALEDSCQSVCNATNPSPFSQELYCVIGCNDALNFYFQKVKEYIGTTAPPALVADSLTSTSLSLLWEDAPKYNNLTLLVQWKYEEFPGTWQYCKNRTWQDSIVHVNDLQPYTKYRFRIAIFLSQRYGEPIQSSSSVVISTLPSGKPKSGVNDLRATALGPRSVSLSWEPGAFTNGPILSYVLRITDAKLGGYSGLEDMPASNKTLFYIFQNLLPSSKYYISVSMRNEEGEGPTTNITVFTSSLPAVKRAPQPMLILGGIHTVMSVQADDILSEPLNLYSTDYLITGVGVDISLNLLFVSESNGNVYKTSIFNKTEKIPLLNPAKINYKPLEISMDWLNKQLYIVSEVTTNNDGRGWGDNVVFTRWDIMRFDYDGTNSIIVHSGLNVKPTHVEVDPYNGYLFWVMQGVERGGIYRLDLSNISNNMTATPEYIVRDQNLGAFIVDFTNYRLLVAHLRKNTVLAVSLDGHSIQDFRDKTHAAKFSEVKSISYVNGLFYWSNGNKMLTEEMHPITNVYYHNEYPLSDAHAIRMIVGTNQPLPTAVSAARQIEVLCGQYNAKVIWKPPLHLPHQSRAAWTPKTYTLRLTSNNSSRYIYNISGLSTDIEGLQTDTSYSISVAPVASHGMGPWAVEFETRTLANNNITKTSSLIWSGSEGLFQTDLLGENPSIINKISKYNIVDMAYYKDIIYLVTNMSVVIATNITSKRTEIVSGLNNVASLDVDWYGKRLYWSNPKQQLICHESLNEREDRSVIPLVVVARTIRVDSVHAYIYWSSGHGVEAATLTGDHRVTYYPAQMFSGNRVTALTLEAAGERIYWVVRDGRGAQLQWALAAHLLNGSPKVESVRTEVAGGWGGCAAAGVGRVWWMRSESEWRISAISTLQTLKSAGIKPEYAATQLILYAPYLQRDADNIRAIPSQIRSSSIILNGTWNNITISWEPDTSVNVGKVYYDVSLICGINWKYEYRTTNTSVILPPDVVCNSSSCVNAYTLCKCSVRACTAWGTHTSNAPRMLRTPPAPPSAPERPRLYANAEGGSHTIILRWNKPILPNGEIRGYNIICWIRNDESKEFTMLSDPRCTRTKVEPINTELIVRGVNSSHTVSFQVQAYTDAGVGPYSEEVSIKSDFENPIPKVIMSSADSLKIYDLDFDESVTIPKSSSTTVDFCVSIKENLIYWLNNVDEIFSTKIDGSGNNKAMWCSDTAWSVSCDWVSRSLVWSQQTQDGHAVYSNPVVTQSAPKMLFYRERPPKSLALFPEARSIFWYEETDHPELGSLMVAQSDGTNVRSFFNNSKIDRARGTDCNCPENPQVGQSFVLDLTIKNNEVIWVDPWVNNIIASDINGCRCRTLVPSNQLSNYGLPPDSITVDSKNVYWLNSSEGLVYYTDKTKITDIIKISVSPGYKIVALDTMTQPYPPRKCLVPKQVPLHVSLLSRNTTGLELKMPNPVIHEDCQSINIEMTPPLYIIQYKKSSNSTSCDLEACMEVSTYDKRYVLKDLMPYTNYTIQLQVKNYFSILLNDQSVVGPPVIFRTAAEAPPPASNMRVYPLSPVLALIQWDLTPGIIYEVHTRSEEPLVHNTVSGENGSAIVRVFGNSNGTIKWRVWVRARAEKGAQYSDTQHKLLVLPAPPQPPRLYMALPRELIIQWSSPNFLYSYNIEFSWDGKRWQECERNKSDMWHAKNLTPAYRYYVRLALCYRNGAPMYYWPEHEVFSFNTTGTIPDPPGTPTVVHGRDIRWSTPAANGDNIHSYRLWAQPSAEIPITSERSIGFSLDELDNNTRSFVEENNLILLYNGSDSYWFVIESEYIGHYLLYAQACNSFGWSDFSEASVPIHLGKLTIVAAQGQKSFVMVTTAALLTAFTAFVLVVVICLYRRRGSPNKGAIISGTLTTTIDNPRCDIELAALRALPRSLPAAHNALYGAECPNVLNSLPCVARQSLALSAFLGAGAFGEVFSGCLTLDSYQQIDVAVKTLRKCASDREKREFLEEACLMWSLKHEHILQLLGVCLDSDPSLIIMELMDGGDLLTYLRRNRDENWLDTRSLVEACRDVCRGCVHLSSLRFVHRDIAARNCLVSLPTSHKPRKVKIGDFGLARDIYKNDYYRKEGEGLLPVRWMAVECLAQGVFSVQSDVWAWGVLCWEVITKGDQPYPACSNREVLALVRSGTTPVRPPNCPDLLFDLLTKCWSYRPEDRPSFQECLDVLDNMLDTNNFTITDKNQTIPNVYLTLIDDGDDKALQELIPIPSTSNQGKSFNKIIKNDGYEIPRRDIRLTTRHSIVGITPNRLVKPHLYRTSSLRHNIRPTNATIMPLRSVKRRSVCDTDSSNEPFVPGIKLFTDLAFTHKTSL